MSITSVAVQFTIIDLLSKGVDRIKDRLQSLSSASQEVRQSFDRMNKSLKVAAISGAATREMYKGLKPAVSLAGDLQAELIGTKAELSGAGKSAATLAKEMRQVKRTAFEVQAWAPFDMSQVVALEKGLIKAGASVEEVTAKGGAAAASAALAVYEGMDPLSTGQALIGIGTPFKVAASEYMSLADDISRAASASTTGAQEIAETAKYAAGPMANLGRSTREMFAMSAVMAQVGISGSMAGTSLKAFFNQAAEHKEFRDASGNLLPTVEIIELLRKNLAGLGDAQKTTALNEIFSERGTPVALALLNKGKGSYEEILKAMEEALSLQDKLKASMAGFQMQLASLRGTSSSVIADLFQPALKPLTAIVASMNQFVTLIGTASQESEGLGKAVSGISLGGVVTGGAITAAAGSAALIYGRRVLKGVGGFKGLLRGAGGVMPGIAAGKAVEAATGVTPVFVTNWPPGFSAGAAAAGLAGGGKPGMIKNLLGKIPRGSTHLLGAGKGLSWLTKGLTVAAAGAGTTAAAVGAAGLAGYGIGTAINKAMGDPAGALGVKLYDLFHKESEVKNDIELNVQIDRDGRVMSESKDMNTHINVPRGAF